ncbi:uncharacterized protein PHALS_02198 [Plasmopara halstedii]|uniref:Uncharacterized protein n=1 Tax=Plasmopara halstedii TaxID=4781 RepID=A0A0P1A6Q3_PLAHL|nr:uncharacterized protein PHALS_02198 [Plasmopara halstedii]CEG36289.1 hypothetical protein PHALS_02198 [Plasmopara halstedii]|eukprot:XP_024572658.1 hypothetical protein PHALS_02198 [Plasmopara halstedii]
MTILSEETLHKNGVTVWLSYARKLKYITIAAEDYRDTSVSDGQYHVAYSQQDVVFVIVSD